MLNHSHLPAQRRTREGVCCTYWDRLVDSRESRMRDLERLNRQRAMIARTIALDPEKAKAELDDLRMLMEAL